ncbi:MAG TPA: site-2 protease family protein [Solirubrobacteraceae bacterium]|nr:site-2 protease family protein [Solirubrobacteraceae bacterium]
MSGTTGSIKLGTIFGIRIGATPSWFLVLFGFIYFLTGYFQDVVGGSDARAFGLAVVASLLFFASIVLHELGHAVVARRNGIGIVGIDLFFFGGLAHTSREAETPGAEFRVAGAGPAVTAIVIGASIGAGALASHSGDVIDSATFSVTTTGAAYALLGWLAAINASLLVLNLVPALPLDGGRMARAIAWRLTGDRARATRAAARVGQGFAYLVIAAGVWLLVRGDAASGIWLVLVGIFLSQAARGELQAASFSQRLAAVTVADVMDHEPVTIPAATTALAAQDEYFLRYRWPWFAVVADDGRFRGVLRGERVDLAVAGGQPALPVSELVEDAPERFRIGRDRSLEALLAEPALRELGALMAVDGDGRLVGVVTIEQVRRALVGATPASHGA